MGDALKKVQAGQPLAISAEAFNSFIDAARAVRANRHDVAQDPGLDFRQSGIIKVKNNSGADRARFDVLGIEAPLFDPAVSLDSFKARVAVTGITPDPEKHFAKFVVLAEPLKAGAIGWGCASGLTVARVKINGESDPRADVGDTADALASGHSGAALILWKEPAGSGPRWALIKIGLPQIGGSGSGSGSGSGTGVGGSGSGSGSDGSGGSGSGGSGSGGSGSGGSGSGGSGSGGSGSGGSGGSGTGNGTGSGTGGDGGGSGSGTGGSGGCKKSFTGNLADIPEGTATAGGWTIGIDENGCLVKYRHDPDTCGEGG